MSFYIFLHLSDKNIWRSIIFILVCRMSIFLLLPSAVNAAVSVADMEGFFYYIYKVLVGSGFEQIIQCPDLDSSFGIIELIKGRKKYNAAVRIKLLYLSRRIKAVHAGHLDIKDRDLTVLLPEDINRLYSVLSKKNLRLIREEILYFLVYDQPLDGLVVCNQYSVHCCSFSHLLCEGGVSS